MSKIPVGAIIAHAYRFAFEKFPAVLGVVWLPWALLCAGNYLAIGSMSTLLAAAAAQPETALHFGSIIWLVNLLTYTMMAVQFIGVTKLAFGLPVSSRYFYFSLDKSLLRLLAAIVAIFLSMIVAVVVVIVGGALLVFLINLLPLPVSAATLLKALVFVVAFSAFVYFIIRLTFLITPVVVVEERIGLVRSWKLGRGNFWRMFAIFLSVVVPLVALELILIFGFLWHGLPPMPQPNATAQQIAANQANIVAWYAASIGEITRYWYIVYPVFLVISAIFTGLLAGAQTFAYRALTTGAEALS